MCCPWELWGQGGLLGKAQRVGLRGASGWGALLRIVIWEPLPQLSLFLGPLNTSALEFYSLPKVYLQGKSLHSHASVPSSVKRWCWARCPLGPYSPGHLCSEGCWVRSVNRWC